MSYTVLFQQVEIPAPGANTSFGAVTIPGNCMNLVVVANLATGSVFKARVGDGVTTNDEDFLAGAALVAGSTYAFDLPIAKYSTDATPRVMTAAFQVETDGIINRLMVLAELS